MYRGHWESFMLKLESSTLRNTAIPTLIKVVISLRLFASNSFQIIIAYTFNVDQSTVSRPVHSVYNALVRRPHRFIKFPTVQGIEENKRKFYDIGNFQNIFGLIDGTHVRIIAPSQHGDKFVNMSYFCPQKLSTRKTLLSKCIFSSRTLPTIQLFLCLSNVDSV